MRAYIRFRTFEARDADGKTAADHSREMYGTEPPELEMEFPPNFLESETVGLIYDEVEGLNFYANYGQLADVFASPKLATQRDYRRAVLEYLKEPSISTLPFRRLAERNHEHASRVFQVVLKQPAFDWERDGEKLLRRYKKRWFEQPILPSITPVGDPLARANGLRRRRFR